MRCPNCDSENHEPTRFCIECGAAFKRSCPKCGFDNLPQAKFCGDCGVTLAADGLQSLSIPRAPEASAGLADAQADISAAAQDERKTVTALFADIKGSTELMEDLDPEEARAIIDPALKIMVEAVRRYEGYVVQSTGDGIFALFGAPVAHEDHPQRALYAALQMQLELRRLSKRAAHERTALEARIGVNTGEVVVRTIETGGKMEYTPIGHTANLASRLQSVAPVGSIAIGDDTLRLVEGYFEVRVLGPTAVKGIGGAINVYEVIGSRPLRTHFQLARRRGLTRFVGRERELAEMQRVLELARDGRGQVIAVRAEAGTGKSRLFYEFKATVAATGCKQLEAYSVSHGKASAWLPLLELLRGYFGIDDADDLTARRKKVSVSLGILGTAQAESLPYLFGLMGLVDGADPLAQMDPQIRRQRTLDVLKRLIVCESLAQPTVVIFEDLHWIDEQTQALLDLLVESIADTRVLLLVNYRPEYRHKWNGTPNYTQIELDPLGSKSAEELLAALIEDAAELRPLKRLIIERSGGNPFFIEEMVQALFDQGALVRNGAVKITRSLSQLRLPTTVQGVLAARIDRQPGDHKQLLQILAVLGRESSLRLLSQVASHSKTELERILMDLLAGEFIYGQPAATGVELVFKHALTQEVAYNSLLIERRKQLHERAGQSLEAMFAGQLDDHLGELAHHYSHSDNLDKAIEYLGRSGQQAMQRSAHVEAIDRLSEALELLQKLPDSPKRTSQELPLQLALGQAFIPSKGWSAVEVEQPFKRASAICEQLHDARELFPALFGLWSVHHVRGQYNEAQESGALLLELAESLDDRIFLIMAHYALGETFLHTGDLLLAREHQLKMLDIYDPHRDSSLIPFIGVDFKQGILSYTGWTLWLLGYPDQAVTAANQAIEMAKSLSHSFSLSSAEFFLNVVHSLRRDFGAAEQVADQVIAYSTEHGFSGWLLFAPRNRAWAIVEQGRGGEPEIRQIREALAIAGALGANIGRTHAFCQLAETLEKIGHIDEALEAVNEALTAVEKQNERYWEPEIYRLKGELLLKKDSTNCDATLGWFERAISISRQQNGKSLELRATISLARLLTSQGRLDEARTMLAGIYSWFTEGFDTADLRDAKSLLEELSL